MPRAARLSYVENYRLNLLVYHEVEGELEMETGDAAQSFFSPWLRQILCSVPHYKIVPKYTRLPEHVEHVVMDGPAGSEEAANLQMIRVRGKVRDDGTSEGQERVDLFSDSAIVLSSSSESANSRGRATPAAA